MYRRVLEAILLMLVNLYVRIIIIIIIIIIWTLLNECCR